MTGAPGDQLSAVPSATVLDVSADGGAGTSTGSANAGTNTVTPVLPAQAPAMPTFGFTVTVADPEL